jgi:hypothetical protein
MRVFIVAAATVVLLAGPAPAYSQAGSGPPATKTPMQLIDEQKARDAAEVERQYERRQKRPDADAKNDPWRNMRATDPPPPRR